jgi:hypothetical protein
MKKVLLLMVAVLMVSSVAMADHIGVYSDASGSSCLVGSGFQSNVTVIHRSLLGATGSRFKITLPAGSAFFAFNTSYVPVGNMQTDLSLGYGDCLTGSFVIGTIVANLTSGTISVLPADTFVSIIYTDCTFAELPATGGNAYVAPATGNCNEPLATEQSTWGQVKALYR